MIKHEQGYIIVKSNDEKTSEKALFARKKMLESYKRVTFLTPEEFKKKGINFYEQSSNILCDNELLANVLANKIDEAIKSK